MFNNPQFKQAVMGSLFQGRLQTNNVTPTSMLSADVTISSNVTHTELTYVQSMSVTNNIDKNNTGPGTRVLDRCKTP